MLLELLELLGGLFSESASSEELARRSRSSRRFLSFLPIIHFCQSCRPKSTIPPSPGAEGKLKRGWMLHTVVALSNAVLDPSSLGKVGDLGPILVGVGGAAEGTAGSMASVLSGRWRNSRVGVMRLLHGEHCERL